MSRTIKKDRYNKKSKWHKQLAYKCRCEYCLNPKYKLRKQTDYDLRTNDCHNTMLHSSR